MSRHFFRLAITSALIIFSAANAHAESSDYVLTLKDHVFSPAELVIPADQKIKITIKNLQSSPAEFESEDLEREKAVSANGTIVVLVGPLKAGKYNYVDDFHRETTGAIIAK